MYKAYHRLLRYFPTLLFLADPVETPIFTPLLARDSNPYTLLHSLCPRAERLPETGARVFRLFLGRSSSSSSQQYR